MHNATIPGHIKRILGVVTASEPKRLVPGIVWFRSSVRACVLVRCRALNVL